MQSKNHTKSKIFFILAPSMPPHLIESIAPHDIVIVGLESDIKLPNAKNIQVTSANKGQLKEITVQIANSLDEIKSEYSQNILKCFVNDLYAYSIRPAWSHLLTLQDVINETGISDVTVVCAKHSGKQLPMLGFKTTESKRGSALLFGAYLSTQLPKAFPGVQFNYEYVSRDIFCIEPLRKITIRVANFIFSGSFLIKSLWGNWINKKKSTINKTNSTLIVRVDHQKRFAANLLNETRNESISVLILPQLSYGSFASLKNLYGDEQLNTSAHIYPARALIKAVQATKKDSANLRKNTSEKNPFVINCNGIKLQYDWNDIAREVLLMSVVLLYKNTLESIVKASTINTLINFELVGRMAGVEALVAKQNKINLKTIQTAVVSTTPHVIFPVSPTFYCDGAKNIIPLNSIGTLKQGIVKYAGAPFTILQSKKVKAFTTITFFTQPYEHKVTCSILKELAIWGTKQKTKIIIKLHPRDDESIYSKLLLKFPNTLSIVDASPETLLKNTSLCITKTSSVAKEALALGIPIILCLWSEFDKSIVADYVSEDEDLNYKSYGANDLHSLLKNPENICDAAYDMSKKLFSSKGISDLAHELLN